MVRHAEKCDQCERHIKAYNARKCMEYELVRKYDTKDVGEGRFWYSFSP